MTAQLPEYLDRLAQIQHGVLAVGQALASGVSRDTVRTQVRTGRWRPLHHGVYAAFTGTPSREATLWAAVLRGGSGALLSHYSAADVYSLSDYQSRSIHLTIPRQRRVVAISGVIVHYSDRAEQAAHPADMPPRTRVEE